LWKPGIVPGFCVSDICVSDICVSDIGHAGTAAQIQS
jgi:hypothetical protein